MLALALVWWAWSAFAWVTNAHDPDSGLFRLTLLLATGLIFIAGLALPLSCTRPPAISRRGPFPGSSRSPC